MTERGINRETSQVYGCAAAEHSSAVQCFAILSHSINEAIAGPGMRHACRVHRTGHQGRNQHMQMPVVYTVKIRRGAYRVTSY